MVDRPTVDEVQNGYNGTPVETEDLASSGDFDNPDEAEQAILEAVSMFNNVFSDKILYTAETLDAKNAVRLLARHKWAIALGDTISSEGQAGANVTYNVPTATERNLSRTVYGSEFLEYTRNEPNVSVFRTR